VEKYPKIKWRKKVKIARLKIQEGSYYNAAQYLEDAYKVKPDKLILLTYWAWLTVTCVTTKPLKNITKRLLRKTPKRL